MKDEHWVDRSAFGHIRLHADSLQVQTSRGNYLSSLTIRSDQVDFDDPGSWDRNMDDLILKAAKCKDEHWVDRSAFLKVEQSSERTKSAAKVVLLSLDRNRASRCPFMTVAGVV